MSKKCRMLLAGLLVLVATLPAGAVVPIPEPPLAQRVALADCIIVGKVTAMEDEAVEALPLLKIPGAKKIPYQIAVVKVQSAVRGVKDLSQLRVGYVLPPVASRGIPPRFRRLAQVKLAVDQEACFFLRKHPEESFYVVQAFSDVLDKAKAKDFAKEVARVRHCAKLLNDPNAGLRSKDADDRRLTAALLIFRYRTATTVYTGTPKTEPIDAGQSKLILAVLAEGPWTEEDSQSQVGRLRLFLRLGLTEKDGWLQPRSPQEMPAAAQKWLRDHGATYRIQRYVPEETFEH